MDAKTLYTIMFVEDLFIVLFVLIYIRQYRVTGRLLLLFAAARLLQGIMWLIAGIGLHQVVAIFTAHTALSFGIALESYCLIAACKGFDRRKVVFLISIALLTVIIDIAAVNYPQVRSGAGNFLTSLLLFYAWWHMAFGAERTIIQRLTGWLIFFRGFLILASAIIIDLLFFEYKQVLTTSFNTIVASVTIFSPLLLLFILKERDDLMLQENQNLILQNNAELTQLNATRDKFFSIIAHDLRAPFNNILGLLELLNMELAENDYSNVKDYTRSIKQSAEQNFELLNNLLQWSRSQTNRISFSPENCDLRQMVDKCNSLLGASLKEKKLQFINDVPAELRLCADVFMIDTILRNLLSNAVKYTPENGSIRVEAELRDAQCRVSIVDTGVGMNEAVRSGLFKIDRNTSSPGTNKETGTGLGLILCREFVERHGGIIEVHSEEGAGSCFSFSIPTGSFS